MSVTYLKLMDEIGGTVFTGKDATYNLLLLVMVLGLTLWLGVKMCWRVIGGNISHKTWCKFHWRDSGISRVDCNTLL